MELTAIAAWLNETFNAMDTSVLSMLHGAAEKAGGILTPLMSIFSFTANRDGLYLLLFAVVLMLFAPKRKMGLCMFGAVCCGAILSNMVLKVIVQRPRPYEMLPDVMEWMRFVGGAVQDSTSFPSGHATAAMATAMSLFLNSKHKKVTWLLFPYALLVALSRNYLMAHYPSDTLFGLLTGCVAALIAFPIANFIFVLLEKFEKLPLFHFLLRFDIRSCRGKHARKYR